MSAFLFAPKWWFVPFQLVVSINREQSSVSLSLSPSILLIIIIVEGERSAFINLIILKFSSILAGRLRWALNNPSRSLLSFIYTPSIPHPLIPSLKFGHLCCQKWLPACKGVINTVFRTRCVGFVSNNGWEMRRVVDTERARENGLKKTRAIAECVWEKRERAQTLAVRIMC